MDKKNRGQLIILSVYLSFVAKIKQVLRVVKTHASTCFFYIIYLYYIYYLHYRARTRESKEELKPIKFEVRGSKGARYVARLSRPTYLVCIEPDGPFTPTRKKTFLYVQKKYLLRVLEKVTPKLPNYQIRICLLYKVLRVVKTHASTHLFYIIFICIKIIIIICIIRRAHA